MVFVWILCDPLLRIYIILLFCRILLIESGFFIVVRLIFATVFLYVLLAYCFWCFDWFSVSFLFGPCLSALFQTICLSVCVYFCSDVELLVEPGIISFFLPSNPETKNCSRAFSNIVGTIKTPFTYYSETLNRTSKSTYIFPILDLSFVPHVTPSPA